VNPASNRYGKFFDDETRKRGVELYVAVGTSKAAREIGCSTSAIVKWAKAAGKLRYTERTKAANKARSANAAERRGKLSAALLADAERLRQQLFAPCMAHNFGGKDNTYNDHELPEPDFGAKAQLLKAIGVAIDKHLALERHDADGGEGLAAVDQWLKSMLGGRP